MTSSEGGGSPLATVPPEAATGAVALAWTVHPARQSIARLIAGVIATTAAAVLIGASAGNVLAGVSSAVLLVLSLRRFYFPTQTRLDEHGICVRCLGMESRRAWTRLRRFRYDEEGAFLSTRASPSLLDALTGLHLTWGDHREQAIAFITRQIPGGE